MTELLGSIAAGGISLSVGFVLAYLYSILSIKQNVARTYRSIRRARRLKAKYKARMSMYIPDNVIATPPQAPTTAKYIR
jgi:predicted nucleic acid-binding protein